MDEQTLKEISKQSAEMFGDSVSDTAVFIVPDSVIKKFIEEKETENDNS
jgi:hypothetical protein